MDENTIKESKLHRAIVHVLVVLFGVGAWVAINGVWVELPLLVERLPEFWNLPSFLVIIMQAANIGPLVVTIMQACCSRFYHQNVLIYIMLVSETAACFLLIFFWSRTAVVGGTEHSVAFFALFFVLGFTDCTSSVTFMPYMTKFQTVFLTTYFIGEGLSGFVPSIFALIQGVGQGFCENSTLVNQTSNETYYEISTKYGQPRFSVEVFFGLLFVMMVFCSTAFTTLDNAGFVKAFMHEVKEEDISKSTATELTNVSPDGNDVKNYSTNNDQEEKTSIASPLTISNYVYFYILIFWVSLISNGALPSVISYSSLPYGQLPYHFAATLGAMANPVACFIALFLPVRSNIIIGAFVVITTGFAAYLLVLAIGSPCPVLVDTAGGSTLMVLSQILFVFTTSYAKVSIGQVLRERGSEKSLVWYGAATQLGALVGACIMFPLVNVYHYFSSGDHCKTICY